MAAVGSGLWGMGPSCRFRSIHLQSKEYRRQSRVSRIAEALRASGSPLDWCRIRQWPGSRLASAGVVQSARALKVQVACLRCETQLLEPSGRGLDYQMGGKLELGLAGLLGIFRNFYRTDCRTVKAGTSSAHREGAVFREREKSAKPGRPSEKGIQERSWLLLPSPSEPH